MQMVASVWVGTGQWIIVWMNSMLQPYLKMINTKIQKYRPFCSAMRIFLGIIKRMRY